MSTAHDEQRARPHATTTAVVTSLSAVIAAVVVAHLSRGALGHHDSVPTALLLGSSIGSLITAVVLAPARCGSYRLAPLLIAAQLALSSVSPFLTPRTAPSRLRATSGTSRAPSPSSG